MKKLSSRNLLNLIRFAPVVAGCITAAVAGLIALQNSQETITYSINNLREELLDEQREVIRDQIRGVSSRLILEKSLFINDLKHRAKKRVHEAYTVAYNIYNNNPEKSESEITQLISDALRPIQFFNGRGYYFIFDNDGMNVMHASYPVNEGKPFWDVQDVKGAYIVREMSRIVKQKKEGFYQWWFQKPGAPVDEQFRKIGYVKKFEPYNWIIGTGEYIADVAKDNEQQMLKWLSEYEYGDAGYFFVLSKQGEVLSHHKNDFLGLDLSVGDYIDEFMLADILSQTKKGGGYIKHQKPLTLSGKVSLEQVSYVKQIKDTDWIIGTGFYSESFNNYLDRKESNFIEKSWQGRIRFGFWGVASILLLISISFLVGQLIANKFTMFNQRVNRYINKLEQAKDKMKHMAHHDILTGLPNRALFSSEVEKKRISVQKNGKLLAVMFVDLNSFSRVNDLYGHTVGDKLLTRVGIQFASILGANDIVSRFGGDEFVFCFSELNDIEGVTSKAASICEVLQVPFVVSGKLLSSTCSIGVSVYPGDGDDVATLISNADIALYKSKKQHQGEVLFYDAKISDQLKYDLQVESELKQAVKNGEISVHYQPQVSTKNGELVGVEALARWSSPKLGRVSPDKFITVAEDTGRIHEIGLFVFKQACTDIGELSPSSEIALKLSVNISPKQLAERNFIERFVAICRETGMERSRVTLEITETALIQNLSSTVLVLARLRDLGFGISLDDFGTGYSSLSYINNLPLTEIKIDRSFVTKMQENVQSDMLVKMIIGIGKSCGTTVLAEGVESREQLKQLIEYECCLVQGYFLDRPLTIEQLTKNYNESRYYEIVDF